MTIKFEIKTKFEDSNQSNMASKKGSPKSVTKLVMNNQVKSTYQPVSAISQSIVNLQIKYDQLRDSSILKKLIVEIFQLNSDVIKSDSLEASLRRKLISDLLIHELCIPHLLSLIGVGFTIGFLSENDKIQGRVKNILCRAFNLLKHSEDHLSKNESDGGLDFDRFELFVDLIKFNSTPLLPHSITLNNNGPFVLKQLSCHILGVAAVSPALSQAVSQVVSYIAITLSNNGHSWSLDEKTAEVQSTVIEYFTWLRANSAELSRLSSEEAVLQSVDLSVRAWLRNEHYSSPVELISVYKQKYRGALSNIFVPLATAFSPNDVLQAVDDLNTSRVIVNGSVIISPIASETEHSSEVFTPLTDISDTSSDPDSHYRPAPLNVNPSPPTSSEVNRASLHKVLVELSTHPEATSAALSATPTEGIVWQQDLLEMLHTQTILASSRAFSAGSAFLILSDLFGGDGLVFCPVELAAEPSSSLRSLSVSPRSPTIHTRKKSISESSELTVGTSSADISPPRYADVSISINEYRVKITLKERYGLYPDHDEGHCDGHHATIKTLCNFETTTVTSIRLRPEGDLQEDRCFSLYSGLLNRPETVCERTVTIAPYLAKEENVV